MRRRRTSSRLRWIAGAGLLMLFALVLGVSVQRYREPAPAPPAALDRIAQKNRHAAAVAAANQRAEAAASSDAADNVANGANAP